MTTPKPEKQQHQSDTAPQFDDVLKRMLSSPPDPKRPKSVKKDEKKKPAEAG